MDVSDIAGHVPTSPGKPSHAKPLKSVVLNTVLDKLGVEMRMNMFTWQVMVKFPGKPEKVLTDGDEALIRDQMFARDASVHPQVVSDRLQQLALQSSFHPVQEYLESLTWDGKSRVDTWLSTYLDIKDSPYTRHVGMAMLCAAVRRVYQPGCKFDTTLVLIGDEGSGKSTTVKLLAPKPEWFSESLPINASPKLVVEGTQGIWLVESPEIVTHKDVGKVKDFLSRGVDGPVRKAYAHNADAVPRQFVVFGTTNDAKPIADETGVRRFWPVKMGTLDDVRLRADRDQLWAEAFLREMESGHEQELFMPGKLAPDTEKAQRQFTTLDPWVDTIGGWLQGERPQDTGGKVLIEDLWKVVEVSKSSRNSGHSVRLTNVMGKLGFKRSTEDMYFESRKRKCPYFYRPNPFVEGHPTDMAGQKWDEQVQAEIDEALDNGAVLQGADVEVEEPSMDYETEQERRDRLEEEALEKVEYEADEGDD
jgi:predicted P-loop ATPase